MNEEEKKAVERIEDIFYSDLGKGINKLQKITLYEDSIRDVRILLNLIEKLQNENKELRKLITEGIEFKINSPYENYFFEFMKENFIPVQKIKDKIEGIQEEGYWLFTTDRDSDKCVEVLQELLEK